MLDYNKKNLKADIGFFRNKVFQMFFIFLDIKLVKK